MTRLTLDLPEPMSPNALPRHSMERVRAKNRLKRDTWLAAIQQEKPTSDPPDPVLVRAHFRLWNLRDEDNAAASLKWTLDALRLPREADDVSWRGGLYERKGYLVDDSPDHMTLGEVTQEIDRADRGLVLTIVDLEALEATTHNREVEGERPDDAMHDSLRGGRDGVRGRVVGGADLLRRERPRGR